MNKQNKFVGWLLGENPFPFFQDPPPKIPKIYGIDHKPAMCTHCYNKGWAYNVDRDGKVEDCEACFKCEKGQTYSQLTEKEQKILFDNFTENNSL